MLRISFLLLHSTFLSLSFNSKLSVLPLTSFPAICQRQDPNIVQHHYSPTCNCSSYNLSIQISLPNMVLLPNIVQHYYSPAAEKVHFFNFCDPSIHISPPNVVLLPNIVQHHYSLLKPVALVHFRDPSIHISLPKFGTFHGSIPKLGAPILFTTTIQ